MRFSNKESNSKLVQFDRLHKQYCERIYNFVLKISRGNTYVAEEITQIVFLKLWEKIQTIDENENVKSYLFSIARNTMLNYLKHDTVEYIYLNYLRDSVYPDNATENSIDQAFLNDYMDKLIDRLPPVRQKVFRMSRIQYLSTSQISERLGISISTVETHLALALKFMREQLKRHYGLDVILAISTIFTL